MLNWYLIRSLPVTCNTTTGLLYLKARRLFQYNQSASAPGTSDALLSRWKQEASRKMWVCFIHSFQSNVRAATDTACWWMENTDDLSDESKEVHLR